MRYPDPSSTPSPSEEEGDALRAQMRGLREALRSLTGSLARVRAELRQTRAEARRLVTSLDDAAAGEPSRRPREAFPCLLAAAHLAEQDDRDPSPR